MYKTSPEIETQICNLALDGMKFVKLASKFGVHRATIRNILVRKGVYSKLQKKQPHNPQAWEKVQHEVESLGLTYEQFRGRRRHYSLITLKDFQTAYLNWNITALRYRKKSGAGPILICACPECLKSYTLTHSAITERCKRKVFPGCSPDCIWAQKPRKQCNRCLRFYGRKSFSFNKILLDSTERTCTKCRFIYYQLYHAQCRLENLQALANGSPIECVVTGETAFYMLTIGHPNNDGKIATPSGGNRRNSITHRNSVKKEHAAGRVIQIENADVNLYFRSTTVYPLKIKGAARKTRYPASLQCIDVPALLEEAWNTFYEKGRLGKYNSKLLPKL